MIFTICTLGTFDNYWYGTKFYTILFFLHFLLRHFVLSVCGSKKSWLSNHFIRSTQEGCNRLLLELVRTLSKNTIAKEKVLGQISPPLRISPDIILFVKINK